MKNKYIPVRKVKDTTKVEDIKCEREKAIFYLKKSIRAGERIKRILNGGDNAYKQTP